MSTFAYDLSDSDLVEAYSQALTQSAVANSGLVVDMMGPTFVENARYLKGVLHARLAGEAPPVRPGAIVRSKKQPNFFDYELRGDLVQTFIVERVIYVGHDSFAASKGQKWHITLCNANTKSFELHHWEDFEIVASDPTTAITAQPA